MSNPAHTTPLVQVAHALLERSHVPYSGRPAAVVLFDAAGRWVPGVRVENASFSLTIPALRNALTTAATLPFGPTTSVATTQALTAGEVVELKAALGSDFGPVSDHVWSNGAVLPEPGDALSPFLDVAPVHDPSEGIALARRIAERAVVPESDFRVGCVAALAGGRLVPGVNVEGADWSHILCAERNVLGTLVSYELGAPETLFLTCLRADCSPCGACRQVLTELAPETRIWMPHRGIPIAFTPADLLPEHFTGHAVRR